MEPLLTLVTLGLDDESEQSLQRLLPRLEHELQENPGTLEFRLYHWPGHRYLMLSMWEDEAAINRWMDNPFHRSVLMPQLRSWETTGDLQCLTLGDNASRIGPCPMCARSTREHRGWGCEECAGNRCAEMPAALEATASGDGAGDLGRWEWEGGYCPQRPVDGF